MAREPPHHLKQLPFVKPRSIIQHFMGILAATVGEQAASATAGSSQHERQGAEIVRGADACYQHSMELLEELGFPKGVMPLKNLEECGRVRATGFVWMKQKAPYEHFFKGTNTRVSYAIEVTAYIEKGKMKRMTGVKSKQMMIWVPIVEMCSIEDGSKVYFKSAMGIGKSFKAIAFEEDEKEENN